MIKVVEGVNKIMLNMLTHPLANLPLQHCWAYTSALTNHSNLKPLNSLSSNVCKITCKWNFNADDAEVM